MLEAIAGLRPLSGGKVRIDGQDVTGLPRRRETLPLSTRITPFSPTCLWSATFVGGFVLRKT